MRRLLIGLLGGIALLGATMSPETGRAAAQSDTGTPDGDTTTEVVVVAMVVAMAAASATHVLVEAGVVTRNIDAGRGPDRRGRLPKTPPL